MLQLCCRARSSRGEGIQNPPGAFSVKAIGAFSARLYLKETFMRGIILWLLGVPVVVIILLYVFNVL
jgi:hypothetical protein